MKQKWPKVAKNDDGIRPAGAPDECFYCKQKVGKMHNSDCVIVEKKVLIKYTITIEEKVPHCWGKEDIEFHRNESSWCADNLISVMQNIADDDGDCLCQHIEAEFIKVTDDTPTRELRKPHRLQ